MFTHIYAKRITPIHKSHFNEYLVQFWRYVPFIFLFDLYIYVFCSFFYFINYKFCTLMRIKQSKFNRMKVWDLVECVCVCGCVQQTLNWIGTATNMVSVTNFNEITNEVRGIFEWKWIVASKMETEKWTLEYR